MITDFALVDWRLTGVKSELFAANTDCERLLIIAVIVPRLAAFRKDRRRFVCGPDVIGLRRDESGLGDMGGIVRDSVGKTTFDALNL